MSVFSVAIICSSGTIVYEYNHRWPSEEVEKIFTFPVPLFFREQDRFITVDFGTYEEIRPGFRISAVNGVRAMGTNLADGRRILDVINDRQNFPLTLMLGLPKITSDMMLQFASLFYGMHSTAKNLTSSIISQADEKQTLRPSGIQMISSKSTNIHCFETALSVKFVMFTDSSITSKARDCLKRIYNAYTDTVLKNPMININQPFHQNAEEFNEFVRQSCDTLEREARLQPISA